MLAGSGMCFAVRKRKALQRRHRSDDATHMPIRSLRACCVGSPCPTISGASFDIAFLRRVSVPDGLCPGHAWP
jgi:hypothetical protein